MKDNLFVQNRDTITVDYAEIKNKLDFVPLDHKGDSIHAIPEVHAFIQNSDYNLTLGMTVFYNYDPNDPIYRYVYNSSDITKKWEYNTGFVSYPQLNSHGNYFNYGFLITDITKDTVLGNDYCKMVLAERLIPNLQETKKLFKTNILIGIGGSSLETDSDFLRDSIIFKEYFYPIKDSRPSSFPRYVYSFRELDLRDSLNRLLGNVHLNYVMQNHFRSFLNKKYYRNTLLTQLPQDKTLFFNHTKSNSTVLYENPFTKINDSLVITNAFMANGIRRNSNQKLVINKFNITNNLIYSDTLAYVNERFKKTKINPTVDKYLEIIPFNDLNPISNNKIIYTIIDTSLINIENPGLDFIYCRDSLGNEETNLIKGKNYSLVISDFYQNFDVAIRKIGNQNWIPILNGNRVENFDVTYSIPSNLDTGSYQIKITNGNAIGSTEFITSHFSVHNTPKEFCTKRVMTSKNEGEGSLRAAIYCIDGGETITFVDNISEIIVVEDLNIDKNLVLKHNDASKPLKIKLRNNASVNITNNARVTFQNVIIEKCNCLP